MNQLAGKWVCLDSLAIFFTIFFEYFLIFFLFLFLFLNFKKYWKMVVLTFIAVVLSRLVLVEIVRWLVPITRPFIEHEVNLLLEHSSTPSFPSGHAAFYFALSMVVFLFLKKLKSRPKYWPGIVIGFFLASFLISISRVFSGLHWPSDILAGALVGIFSGWLVVFISQKFSSGAKKLSLQ